LFAAKREYLCHVSDQEYAATFWFGSVRVSLTLFAAPRECQSRDRECDAVFGVGSSFKNFVTGKTRIGLQLQHWVVATRINLQLVRLTSITLVKKGSFFSIKGQPIA
jgi:hypothetical protein